MLFSYHLLYFCTALFLIIMLSSHYHHHKSKTFSQLTQCPFTGTLLLFSVSFGISFEHAVQLPFTVFLYSPFPDNYAFLSLSPSQIKNIQSADTVPVHGHSPLVFTHNSVVAQRSCLTFHFYNKVSNISRIL